MRFNRHDNRNNGASPLCVWTQERLFTYADGELSASERTTLQAHLESCDACRTELAHSRRADSALMSARFDIPPAGDLRAGFYAKLAATEAARPPKRPARTWVLALPACAAAMFIAVMWRPVVTQTGVDNGGNLASRNTTESLASRGTIARVPSASHESKSAIKAPSPLAAVRLAQKPEQHPVMPASPVKQATSEDTEKRIASAVNDAKYALQDTRLSLLSKYSKLYAKQSASPKQPDVAKVASVDRTLMFREEAAGKAALGIKSMRDPLNRDALWSMRSQDSKEARSFAMSVQGDVTNTARMAEKDFADKNTAVVLASAPEEGEVSIEVHDEVRGFQTAVRYAAHASQDDEGEVVTIETDEMVDDDTTSTR